MGRNTLVKSGKFRLPGKKALLENTAAIVSSPECP
jgi:hypothetical protein